MSRTRTIDARAVRWVAVLAAALLLLALAPLANPAHAAHGVGEILRLRGAERLETAAVISNNAFPDGAQTVVVARADLFPDALAGSHLAGARNAPILLTPGNRIPETTTAALNQLGATNILIVGGTAAVSTAAENELRARPGANVQRVAGLNRYDTARRIAETVGGPIGTAPGPDGQPLRTAILAFGENWPDALASGPLAYDGRHPILLTNRDLINNETLQALTNPALAIQQVIIPGGFAVVSQAVENQVRGLGIQVVRLRGAERTDTARQLVDLTIRLRGWHLSDADGRNQVNLATGRNFPDALALAPRAARAQSGILLTNTLTDLGGPTRDFLSRNCAELRTVVVAGGTAAVSEQAANQAASLIRCADFVPAGNLTASPATAVNAPGTAHEVSAVGVNANGQPAAGAVYRFEVYREVPAQPPTGTRFLLEGEGAQTRFFTFVAEETVTADAAGTGAFSYTNGTVADADDRVVVCAPPKSSPGEPGDQQAPFARCVGDDGTIPERPWAATVVEKLWRTGTHAFVVPLTTQAEVTADGGRPDPDPNATGASGLAFLVMDAGSNRVCWALNVDKGTATGTFAGAPGSHIHVGGPTTAGPVVVALSVVDDATGTTAGCDTNAAVAGVLADPAGHYVNVHTTDYAPGLVRGQLPAG
jgi:putative cell wall-binding protein